MSVNRNSLDSARVLVGNATPAQSHSGIRSRQKPALGHFDPERCVRGYLAAEARLGQIVDTDRLWPLFHTVTTGSTSTRGCSGVSVGRNQRNQMRPLRCPAVDTQLGWAGRSADTTMIQEPSSS